MNQRVSLNDKAVPDSLRDAAPNAQPGPVPDTEPHSSTDTGVQPDGAWHARTAPEAFVAFSTGARGLALDEASKRLVTHGPNRLPEPPRDSAFKRFARQFQNLLIYVLLAAASVTALLGHLVDTAVILAVVVVNAGIGFVQEGKAEQALAAIRDMLAPTARVIRDGGRHSIEADKLVPGDLVLLEAGDKVPADIRLTRAHGLRIQEAVLTGESLAVEKTTDPVAADVPLGDRRSMAYSGALVAAGTGQGIVVATGGRTQIGRITGLLGDVEGVTTPLLAQMERFASTITLVILLIAACILTFGFVVASMPFNEIFLAVVGLAVAAIPEGLPAILTVTLAIGVQTMARRRAIVRRLPAIEALGSVSVICSDKTGTLTCNQMMVASVATARRVFSITGQGYAPHGSVLLDGTQVDPRHHQLLSDLAMGAALCNDAELHHADGGWSIHGDPMEAALVTFAHKVGQRPSDLRAANPQTDVIAFDATHRFMATLHHDHEGSAAIHVKGAPERIIAMCSRQHGDGEGVEDQPLDAAYWQARADEIAAQGQRVLAVATRQTHGDARTLTFDDVETGLTLLGLVGLIDPPRAEAVRAVADCQAAGISVKMITGDHVGTAMAIARALGLATTGKALTGVDIDRLSPQQLQARVRQVDVFARTSPEHKLRLVEALQASGHTVAMTGDGVNDAPALKQAEIGIAMGKSGTEAAKEAAEIVLTDDNFATIAQAVKSGRAVYDNLKKAITFLLPVNGGEALALIAALLLGLTLPITPVQILWVNMVSSVVLAMALAFEAPEPGIMNRPPRDPKEPILSRFVLWRVVFVSILFSCGIFGMFTWARASGASLEEARTIAVNTLVVMEIFYLFSVRFLNTTSLSFRAILGTRPVLIAIGVVTALQVLFTYAAFMQALFGTQPLSLGQGVAVMASGPILLLVLEAEKKLRATLAPARGVAA